MVVAIMSTPSDRCSPGIALAPSLLASNKAWYFLPGLPSALRWERQYKACCAQHVFRDHGRGQIQKE